MGAYMRLSAGGQSGNHGGGTRYCGGPEALFGMLGWLMPRFAKGEEVSLKDQWRTRVVPRVLRREFVVG